MLGNSFCSHAAKEVCSVSGASSTTSCHICFQTSSSWLKVCGEGNAHSKNWNILSRCTLLISWRFLGIKYIPHAAWTCICENLNSNSESKWSIVVLQKYYFIQYVPKYHQKLGCQANGGARAGRAPPLDPPMVCVVSPKMSPDISRKTQYKGVYRRTA